MCLHSLLDMNMKDYEVQKFPFVRSNPSLSKLQHAIQLFRRESS